MLGEEVENINLIRPQIKPTTYHTVQDQYGHHYTTKIIDPIGALGIILLKKMKIYCYSINILLDRDLKLV
jgi:hypothetical protein